MILPGTYANGFAPRDGRPLYPSLWAGCVMGCAPCLGPTGHIVRDHSGYGLHLTENSGSVNTIQYSLNQGKYALDSTSAGNADLSASRSILDLGAGSWSFGCWARINDTSIANRYLISRTLSGDNDWSMIFGYVAGKIQFYSRAATGFGYPSSNSDITPTQGIWQHIIYTYDGGTYRGYLDGKQVVSYSSVTNVAASGGSAFCWGAFLYYEHHMTQTFLDDLRVYRRCLSAQEIRLLASRRGIAYEMVPRRRSSAVAVTSYSTFRPSVLRGSR